MKSNALVVAAVPSASSVLGNVFSHQEFTHLLTNMVFLWFVGTSCELLSSPLE